MHGGLQPYFRAVVISVLSLGFPLFVRQISLFLTQKLPEQSQANQHVAPHRFNSRFYLPALSISFFVLGFLILSTGVSEIAKEGHSEKARIYGSVFFLMVIFLSLTFLFAIKKGNFNWNVGVQNGRSDE